MNTIIYFIMACSFAVGACSSFGITYMAFSKWGLQNVSIKGWTIWFTSWLTFLLTLWQQGFIS